MTIRVPPLVYLAVFALIAWGLSILLPALDVEWAMMTVLAVGFMATGIFLLLFAVGAFARAGTTVNPIEPGDAETLVTSGLYRFSRNPMYLAMALILIGAAFLVSNLASFLAPALFVCVITMTQIKPEERALKELFGDTFYQYCQRTRRWI